MNPNMPTGFVPMRQASPSVDPPVPVQDSIPVRHGPLVVGVISLGASLVMLAILWRTLQTDEFAWIIMASIILVPGFTLLGIGLAAVFLRLFGRVNTILALSLASLITVGIISSVGWSFMNDHNNSPGVIRNTAASNAITLSDCNKLLDDESYWNGCVSRLIHTQSDFQQCLNQARKLTHPTFNDVSSGVCGYTYALVIKDIRVCDQLESVQDQQYCQSSYRARSQ